MDPQLGYLSNLDGFTALFNLSFSKLSRKFLEKRLPKTRPMDNIEMLIDGPQEESYAVANVSKYGLPNAIIFPRKYEYFAKFLNFEECPKKDLEKWKKIYHRIVQKLTLKHNGKQLVMKDPANAARIKHLLDMYPNAKFIYNYRNPYPLLCSLKLLFQKLLELTSLQTYDKETYERQFTEHIDKFYSAFKEEDIDGFTVRLFSSTIIYNCYAGWRFCGLGPGCFRNGRFAYGGHGGNNYRSAHLAGGERFQVRRRQLAGAYLGTLD